MPQSSAARSSPRIADCLRRWVRPRAAKIWHLPDAAAADLGRVWYLTAIACPAGPGPFVVQAGPRWHTGPSPLTTVPRPTENGERQVLAPTQWRDTIGGQDTMGLSLDLPCTEDPELFFAESPQDVEQAKAMCRGCRARLACLAGALERREPWGVWGGELLMRGAIVPHKRPRGRPRKDVVAIGWLLPLAGLVVAGGLPGEDLRAGPGPSGVRRPCGHGVRLQEQVPASCHVLPRTQRPRGRYLSRCSW